MMSKINIVHMISLNAQGLRNQNKRLRLNEWLNQQNASIFLIQETHFTTNIENSVRTDFEHFHKYHSFGTNNSRGCSILIKDNLNFNLIDNKIDQEGRYNFINIEINKTIYSIFNIYAPNDAYNRSQFFEKCNNIIKDNALGIILMAGDFNTTLTINDRINKNNKTPYKHKTENNLSNIIKTHKLKDIWREIHKEKKQFTWRRKNSSEKSRIDFWLVNEIAK